MNHDDTTSTTKSRREIRGILRCGRRVVVVPRPTAKSKNRQGRQERQGKKTVHPTKACADCNKAGSSELLMRNGCRPLLRFSASGS